MPTARLRSLRAAGSLPPPPGTLTAGRLRVTLVLNATELLAVHAPEGKPRAVLSIRLPDRTITAEIAAKSPRKAQTAIRDAGTDNILPMLKGHLVAGDGIAEAGLSAQPKAAKPPQTMMRTSAGDDGARLG